MYKNSTGNSNSTEMLTACKNLTLPDDCNFVLISVITFFWILSNLELILESRFKFMPWHKFHIRWDIEQHDSECFSPEEEHMIQTMLDESKTESEILTALNDMEMKEQRVQDNTFAIYEEEDEIA